MLDLVGTIALSATIVLSSHVTASAMPVRATTRLVIPAVAGAWTGLAAAAAAAGLFQDTSTAFPPIGALVAAPLMAAGGAALLVPAARRALLGVPMATLISLNIPRVLGFSSSCLRSRTGWVGRSPSRPDGAT